MSVLYKNPESVAPPAGQYSHSVLVPAGKEMLHIAGQVGNRSDGRMAEGFEAQLRQAFENLIAILAAHGMTMANLVKLNYFLTSADHVADFRRVRADYLPDPAPASTTLLVPTLMNPDWLFEIDGIAVR
jgi:2-iminobutanoate/2-iminopropanoate deaminase